LEAVKKKSKGIFIQLKVAGNTIKENDLSRYFNTLDGVDYVGVVHGEEKQCALEHCFLFTHITNGRSAY
jgi:hypothetical protein